MKAVFSTSSEIAHLWANGLDRDVRSRNVFTEFQGRVIYSYGRHYPLAEWTADKDGRKIAVLNPVKWSNTTDKHQREVDRALPHGTYHVYGWPGGEIQTTDYYRGAMYPLLSKLAKARKPDIYIEQIESLVAQATKYYEAFGLPVPAELSMRTIDEFMEEKKKSDYQYEARQKAEREQRQAKQLEQEQKRAEVFFSETLPEWREGKGNNYIHYNPTGFDYFRKIPSNGRIVTTQNVEIPATAARKLWKELLASIAYEWSVDRLSILGFSVKRIMPDIVTIGCHNFTWDELRYAASLVDAPNADARHSVEIV